MVLYDIVDIHACASMYGDVTRAAVLKFIQCACGKKKKLS